MYWCYIDESWRDSGTEHIGVLSACVGTEKDFQRLGREMFRIRKKYFGEKHAKDGTSELKGTKLLSANSFRMLQKHGYSKNLVVAREVLEYVARTPIRYIGVTVYGDRKPDLLAPHAKDLSRPFKELCKRVLTSIPQSTQGLLVFDQRVAAQEAISLAIANYIAGMHSNPRLHPWPLIGVSNVHAGLQLADLAAYILAKWADGDNSLKTFYQLVSSSQLHGNDDRGRAIHGLVRLQDHGNQEFRIRKERLRK